MSTLLSVVGARPQFVKLAPVDRAIKRQGSGLKHFVVHTGQHYDRNMSDSFFEQLELPPADINLNIGSGTHGAQTGQMMAALERVLLDVRPAAVLTYGDTNSTLAATLAAAKLQMRIGHVESGLRSGNRAMPEEINRIVADHCSDRLYAPTPKAMRNLEDENLLSRAVQTGDVMLDAIRFNIELSRAKSKALEDWAIGPGEFALVTIHRAANTTGGTLRVLLAALEEVATNVIDLVFPVHPRTEAVLRELGYRPPPQMRLIAPMSYLDSIRAIEAAAVVITDSGGVQKEAAFLRTPCITVREETEWVETVEIGVNRLVANPSPDLVGAVESALSAPDPFTDRVVRELERHYGVGEAASAILRDCIEHLI